MVSLGLLSRKGDWHMQRRDAIVEVARTPDGSVKWNSGYVIDFVMCSTNGLMAVVEDLDGNVSAIPAKKINLMSIDEEKED
jgi:hypothetical protein